MDDFREQYIFLSYIWRFFFQQNKHIRELLDKAENLVLFILSSWLLKNLSPDLDLRSKLKTMLCDINY